MKKNIEKKFRCNVSEVKWPASKEMNAGFGIHSIIFALFHHQTSIDELLRHFVKQGACVITKF